MASHFFKSTRRRATGGKAAFVLLALLLFPPLVQAKQLVIASWNINNLHQTPGKALRKGAPKRTARDYTLLNAYRKQLNADIIALQEMGSPQAAQRIFPADEYAVIFSTRYNNTSRRRAKDIFTALAIRKEITILQQQDLEQLALSDDGDSFYTRYGVGALVQFQGRKLWILGVHLKAGCAAKSFRSRDRDCAVLKEQTQDLEHWIDAKYKKGVPIIIAGDFNRRINLHNERDHLWGALDDGSPRGLELFRLPQGKKQQCPRHRGKTPIDYFIFDAAAWEHVQASTFREILYSPEHTRLGDRISDHCPIRVVLEIP